MLECIIVVTPHERYELSEARDLRIRGHFMVTLAGAHVPLHVSIRLVSKVHHSSLITHDPEDPLLLAELRGLPLTLRDCQEISRGTS